MAFLGCEKSYSHSDWTPCFRERAINTALPALGLLLSLTIFIVQYALSKRKHSRSALAVARLDPGASNIVEPRSEPVSNAGRPNVFVRVLSALMPWNAPKLLGYQRLSGKDLQKAAANDVVSPATLAVFQTENAMIINEAHSIPLSTNTTEDDRFNRVCNAVQRLVHTIAAVALAALHAAGFAMGGGTGEATWAVVWAYFAILGAFSFATSHSLFTHKALGFFFYFIVAVINLRSALIRHAHPQVITLCSIKIGAAVIALIVTIFFPLQSKVPAHLLAVHQTMQARKQFGIPSTAIPSRAGSPGLRARELDDEDVLRDGDNIPDRQRDLSADVLAFEEPNTEEKSHRPPPPPEVSASLYSRLYFSFVTPAIIKHYSEQFTLPAVPDLPPGDKAASVVAAFRADSSKDAQARRRAAASRHQNGHASQTEQHYDHDEESTSTQGLLPSSRPLAMRLFRHFAPFLVLQTLWAAIQAILELTPAVGLRWFLAYVSQRDAAKNGGPPISTPFHMAVGYVLFMALGQCLSAIAASQALFIGRRICIRLRAILITEIISKTLRRSDISGSKQSDTDAGADGDDEDDSSESKDDTEGGRATDGQVTNLVSVDVFKVSEICAYLHFAFPQAPVTIVFCLYLLYDLLGWSALAGFGMLVLALPLQILVARLFVKLQKRLLEATDRRLNLTTEVLNCIKTVKFFAWEEAFASRLGETRSRELGVLAQRCFAWLGSAFFFIGTPVLVTVVTFGVHTQFLHRPLDAETAFTALALFNLLRMPMDALPDMIVQILSALVSVRRIDKFLRESETEKYEQLLSDDEERDENDPVVGFQDATFVFQTKEVSEDLSSSFSLQNLNLAFPPGELSIIAGPVGSGKTCLLLSLLGETKRISGRTFMPCPIARALEPVDATTGLSETVAYVSQSAWLLGTTVRENIVFGSPFNEKRYKAVLRACSLEPDLKILEYHDETEVGEKGTSLSGGQKARVALARALYSPAKYVLIDDALSAVDAHTAEHLYHHYLKGPLMKGRTCILVTHSVALVLPGAAYAVHLDEGKVTAAGSASALLEQGVFEHETGPRSDKEPDAAQSEQDQREEPLIEELDEEARANEEAEIKRKQDRKKLNSLEEGYSQGAVGLKQYKLYMLSFFKRATTVTVFWIATIALFALSRMLDVATSAWLRKWAASYTSPVEESGHQARPFTIQTLELNDPPATSLVEDRTMYFLKVYMAWVIAFITISLARDGVMLFGALRASRNLYDRMTNAILNARPQFFDRTPIGRIMNRFSKDLEAVDQDVSPSFMFLIDVALQAVVILAVSSWALPGFFFFTIFIVAVYATIGGLYIVSSRDLKRIESVQRSPIFTLVGEVLGGSVAIRAYGDSARFTRHCLRLVDKASRPFFFMWYENRWLSMRVDTFAGLVSLVVGMGLLLKTDVDAALAGFTLSFTVQLVDAALWIVRMITQNEINFNSVERIGEYLNIEPEKSYGIEPPAHWPTASGNIVVDNLTVRYSPEFEPVLKGVSFEVKPGEKVGIVGRTGSGKSTLALSLFRFLEAEAGTITIDGISIGGVPLKTLRRRLTVIPQDAQLFSGTVRSNLDPFSQYDDTDLWTALQRCKLASTNTPGTSRAPTRPGSPSGVAEGPKVFTSLESPIEQGGRNLSAGQRQLVALARGLLKMRDSRILILDESTANLDSASDQQIQQTIRSEMAPSSTILVIAHRLRTIIDFDKILVLDKGNVLEFDSPMKLLTDEGSSFRELCERSGEYEMLYEMAEKADRSRRA